MFPTLFLLLTSMQSVRIQADLHLDTPTQFHRKDLKFTDPEGLEGGLEQLKKGKTNLAVEVLWPPKGVDPRAHVYGLLERLEVEVNRTKEVVMVTTPQRAKREIEADRIAVLVAIEGAHGLGKQDWEATLDDLYLKGLRILGLTWSFSNQFAGSSGDQGGGLTDEGKRLVRITQKMGLLLDLSHASKKSTLEACKGSPVPVIASHSNAAAIHPHNRNLTDEEIKCIADTGGVIGLNFHRPFLGGSGDIQQVVKHANHLAQIGGHNSVALGSDFDGLIRPAYGLTTSADLPALWEALRKAGWTNEQIDGLRGGNFYRAWNAAWLYSTQH